jgi:hypothetical protein
MRLGSLAAKLVAANIKGDARQKPRNRWRGRRVGAEEEVGKESM